MECFGCWFCSDHFRSILTYLSHTVGFHVGFPFHNRSTLVSLQWKWLWRGIKYLGTRVRSLQCNVVSWVSSHFIHTCQLESTISTSVKKSTQRSPMSRRKAPNSLRAELEASSTPSGSKTSGDTSSFKTSAKWSPMFCVFLSDLSKFL